MLNRLQGFSVSSRQALDACVRRAGGRWEAAWLVLAYAAVVLDLTAGALDVAEGDYALAAPWFLFALLAANSVRAKRRARSGNRQG